MPKISRDGGPTWAGHEGIVEDGEGRPSEIDPDRQGYAPLKGEATEKTSDDDYVGEARPKRTDEEIAADRAEGEQADAAEGESSSPGTSYSTSSEKTETDEPKSEPLFPKRARTTASRSSKE